MTQHQKKLLFYLADEWVNNLQHSRKWDAYYHLSVYPEVKSAMRDGLAQHIRDIRTGKTSRFAEGKNTWRDPVCVKCVNERCGDSLVHRKNEHSIQLRGLYEFFNVFIKILFDVSAHK